MKTNKNRITSPTCLRMCLYVMLVMFASCNSCRKDVNALPDATETGANTSGCFVNGRAWVPQGAGGFSGIKPMSGGYNGVGNNVYLRMENSDKTSVVLYLKGVNGTGQYPLSFDTDIDTYYTTTQNFGLYILRGANTGILDYYYVTTSQVQGVVNITKADRTNLLLAGTFSFEGIDRASGARVKISEGRFDINQKTLNP